eukprot:s4422_g4.t1
MTPAGFLDRVGQARGEVQQPSSSSRVQIEILSGSLDGSEAFITPSQPRSFAPPELEVRAPSAVVGSQLTDRSITVDLQQELMAIAKTPLANLAFVSAMGVSSAAEFSAKVAEWARQFEAAVAQVLLRDPGQLENFWSLASKAERLFFESTSFQLGFGLCDNTAPETAGSTLEQLRQVSGVRALLCAPKAPNKKLKSLAQSSDSATPLLDQENNEKAKWAARLEAIGRRAGPAAKLLVQQEQSDDLSPSELARLRQLVLISGAPRTMSAHVRAFERFEHWALAQSLALYPLTVDKILKYCLALDQRVCGSSVVPAFKTSVKWVASRLAIDLPDMDDQRLKAIQDQIVSARATTLKEAVPIPIAAVGALEALVINPKEFA